jgi:glucose-6-phosphate 1-dehydrogenase
VDPILENITPVHEYEPNTWGPFEAERFIISHGDWHNSKPEEAKD